MNTKRIEKTARFNMECSPSVTGSVAGLPPLSRRGHVSQFAVHMLRAKTVASATRRGFPHSKRDEGHHLGAKIKNEMGMQSINERNLPNVCKHPNAVLLDQLKFPGGL